MKFTTQLFQSENLVLEAYDPEKDAADEASFTYDPGYVSAIDGGLIPHPLNTYEVKKLREEEIKKGEDNGRFFFFAIRLKSDNRFLGFLSFPDVFWFNRYAFFKLRIGDPDLSKTYYVEALNLALRYGFEELGLYSIYTATGDFEPEILKALTDAGFNISVRQRENVFRFGKLWDRIFVEILQEAWVHQSGEVQS